MVEFTHTIKAESGLHARPAGLISSAVRNTKSSVVIYYDVKNRCADGSRLLSIMSLGATCGTELRFEIEGEDENEAMATLKEICEASI